MGRLVEAALVIWLHCLLTSQSAKQNSFYDDDTFGFQRQPGERNKMRKHHHHLPFSNKERKPNIILFLTDDQDVELGSLNYMPKTLRWLRDAGSELRHAYTTTPMCCPSRSSLLTGLYMHNHHVYTNNDNCSSTQWQTTHETRSFATYLSNAGYRTGYFGKYLNKYNGSYIPPGWREWGGLIMNSRYYNYSVNINGKKVKHGDDYAKDYFPDLIVNDSISFLRQSKQYFSRKPVLLVLSFPAPHGPEDSAPQFSDMFFNVTSHHTPSYDYAPNSDKQWILQVTGKMQPIHRQFTDLLMTKRLQTLQSVDDAVDRVCQELKSLGELDNTYVVYTSDHGYHLGQFGLVKGKSFPFEFDVRVPFLVRGPGIEPGSMVDNVVLNIDLAPTFLDMAGIEQPPHMDGRSFFKLLFRRKRAKESLTWPDTFLIESSGRRETAEMIAEAKLQESLINIEKNLNQTLEQASSGDLQLDNRVSLVMTGSKMERIALDCQKPEYQPPCKPGQRWQCVADGNRWRKHKCKLRTGGWGGLLPKPKARKCACFTPAGLMYTRLDTDLQPHSFLMRGNKRGESRATRWLELSDEGGEGEAEAEAEHWARRVRRDVRQRLSEIADIHEKILNLEDPKNETDIGEEWNCTVGGQQVNCSDAIYNSPASWRATQLRLEQEIRRLRAHLDKLKEIKKFLKEKKPYDRSAEETDDEDEQIDEEEDDIFEHIFDEVDETPTTEKSFGKHPRRNKNKLNVPTNVPISSINTYNMTSPDNHDKTAKRRKQKIHHESSENTLSKHKHRHKLTSVSDLEEQSTTPFSVQNTSQTKKDWPGPGLGRIDVTILEPVPSLTHKRPLDLPTPGVLPPDTCYCDPYVSNAKDEKEIAREARRRVKEERLRKKERKMRRKAEKMNCLAEKMNCFNHDNHHWRTPPLWTEGPFCFCMNANNNTYSCLRTINKTHNFLYCEFVTGFITYYNLRLDPFEQWNRASLLTEEEKTYLHAALERLKGCRGTKQCTVSPLASPPPHPHKRRPKQPPITKAEDRAPSRTS